MINEMKNKIDGKLEVFKEVKCDEDSIKLYKIERSSSFKEILSNDTDKSIYETVEPKKYGISRYL